MESSLVEKVKEINKERINKENVYDVLRCVDYNDVENKTALDEALSNYFFELDKERMIDVKNEPEFFYRLSYDDEYYRLINKIKELSKEYYIYMRKRFKEVKINDKMNRILSQHYVSIKTLDGNETYTELENVLGTIKSLVGEKALKAALEAWKKAKIKGLLEQEARKTIKFKEMEISCSHDDNTPRLFTSVDEKTGEKKEWVEFYYGSGNGGFKNRYAKIWSEIIDVDILNGHVAALIETGIVTYYYNEKRGKYVRRFLVGFDDGHLFLTQVYSTAENVKEAVERLKPQAVIEAEEAKKEVIRWGDIWFIKSNKKPPAPAQAPTQAPAPAPAAPESPAQATTPTPEPQTPTNTPAPATITLKEITIRGSHKVLGWQEGNCIYAVQAIAHNSHPAPALSGVYKVVTNKQVSQTKHYD